MKIAILGYGKEGQSAERFFRQADPTHSDIQIFDKLSVAEFQALDLSTFDLILRSPSIPPFDHWSSGTSYFFEHCPCPIIGITGTKGKGTTSSIITSILKKLGEKVWLVGNIGTPALDVLTQIQTSDVVVYEMSSFQLWDLKKSPHVAVVLGIEPDHLNVHKDYNEYVDAKANIAKHQTSSDFCVYNQNNSDATKISQTSAGATLAYPVFDNQKLNKLLGNLNIPGKHNQENAQAALLAVAAYYNMSLEKLLEQHYQSILKVFQSFESLPHRLQFLRILNNVKYYDDNFATNPASTQVALNAFPNQDIVLIAGGRDKTSNQDLPELVEIFNGTPNLKKIVLIGESGRELAKMLSPDAFQFCETLADAVTTAKNFAEQLKNPSRDMILLMSPAAASFDMFKNAYDRGDKFQAIVKELE